MKQNFPTTRILPLGQTITNRLFNILSIVVLLTLHSVTAVKAQFLTAASYPFTASAKTFTYLTGGTSVALQSDDITVQNIPIGFTFTYCGINYTTVSACSNGFMALGNKAGTTFTNSLANTAAIRPMLMPLWDDMQGVGSTTSYRTTGSVGSRVFTFEWRNTRPLASTTNPEISIQVKLYEGANAIEFMYQREIGTAALPSATIGIVGPNANDYQTLNNSSAAPTPSAATFTANITAKPASGQSYLWGNLKKGFNNASAVSIVSPNTNFCPGVTLPVSVLVKNNGFNRINNVQVRWELDLVPQPTVNWTTMIDTLGSIAGNSATINLGNVFFGGVPRTLKIYTALPNGVTDTVTNDDTITVQLGAGLAGVYTVGSGGDFPTVVAAANALNAFGVCGAVTMDILDGVYTSQVELKQITGASAINTITFKSKFGNPSNVIIAASPTGTGYVFQLNNASFVTIKDVTIQSNTTNDGRVVEYIGGASNDSLINCTINSTGISSSGNSSGIWATSLTGTNDVFLNNRINRGYYGIYWQGTGTAAASLTKNHIFEGNTITDAYVYSTYFYYTSNLKFRDNIVRAINSPTTHYGIYGYYNDDALEVTGNDFVITGAGQKSGIYMLYSDGTSITNRGIIGNNTIAIDCGTSTAYGIYNYYSNYQNFINNSVSVNSTSTATNAGRFYYSSTAYRFNNIINNAFSNVTGSGYTMYIYSTNTTYTNYWDYNNIHSGSNKLVEQGTPAVTYTTLPSWVAASAGNDANSISYDPGYTSTTDLHPNVNNPACWSLNGRGLHIATNTLDKDNNARVTTRPAGVPDIGAYEFTPEVMPPVAVATPSSADPGDTQIFTFGQREVGRVKWGAKGVVSQLEVRQYSGEKGNGIVAAASPFGTMYFHTDITPLGTGSANDFDLNIDYMDIWLGDIANENELRLAQRVQGYPWMVYSGALSTSNITTNNIDAAQLNRYGSFTGLENGSIPSAFVRPNGKVIICVGSTVVLQAEPQNGDFYKWYRNGIEIPGASGINNKTYTASLAGDYSVAITFSGKIIESVPVTISTIAAPNALINANGPLTYCVGNGLTLNAGTGLGVKYQWQLNGSNIPGATGNTYPVNQAGNYTVVVENIGCASSSVPTQVNAGPIDVKLGDDTTYCEKKNVWMVLDAGYPGAKYLWNTGDTSKTIEVKQGGTYSVTVDGGPGCVGTDAIVVAIDPLPKANGISFVQNGNTYQFFPSGPVGATGFMWIFSDGTISTVDNPIKTITGDLYVRMVMFNACGTDTVQLGWPLAVSNVVEEDVIVVFPNPAKDYVSVKLGGSVTVKEITILNSIGAVVSQTNNLDGKQQHTINVSQLPSGHYMLRATTTDGIVNRQFDIIR